MPPCWKNGSFAKDVTVFLTVCLLGKNMNTFMTTFFSFFFSEKLKLCHSLIFIFTFARTVGDSLLLIQFLVLLKVLADWFLEYFVQVLLWGTSGKPEGEVIGTEILNTMLTKMLTIPIPTTWFCRTMVLNFWTIFRDHLTLDTSWFCCCKLYSTIPYNKTPYKQKNAIQYLQHIYHTIYLALQFIYSKM